MPLHIESSQDRTITVFQLRGSILARDGSSILHVTVAQALDSGDQRLVLDVSQVSEVDAAGVEAMQQLQSQASQLGALIKISGAHYGFIAAMAANGTADLLPSRFDTVDEAVLSFQENAKGVKHFDILQFVKEQEMEAQQRAAPEDNGTDKPAE